ncbi:MAG: type II secretion system protein GspN [Sideroxydans sp.]|nr:type II secretion system protein GspN [Sideroxydans sp.]NOT97680.1 type II secretion system protein GspN [Sideroxydans sp.]
MPSRKLQALLFIAIFIGVLSVWAPAALLTGLLEKTTAGKLTLAQTQGTLWRGAGVLLLRNDNQFLPLGRYTWRILPALDLSSLNVSVTSGNDAQLTQLHIFPWRNEIEIAPANAVLPAQLLAVFAPQLTAYRLSGALILATPHFTIAPNKFIGGVTLDWQQATSGLTDIAPLGDYRITLNGEGEQIKVALTTQSGKLILTGAGKIQPGRALEFGGTAKAAPNQQEALSELLHHIGPELTPGEFTFALLTQ